MAPFEEVKEDDISDLTLIAKREFAKGFGKTLSGLLFLSISAVIASFCWNHLMSGVRTITWKDAFAGLFLLRAVSAALFLRVDDVRR